MDCAGGAGIVLSTTTADSGLQVPSSIRWGQASYRLVGEEANISFIRGGHPETGVSLIKLWWVQLLGPKCGLGHYILQPPNLH